ncbi:uncharacterized protein EI90DRAFT_3090413 [Cantharellus anzutake]|uniref:uncharacterized protein n=1 Tax=Cantharellus anzutake TaxID=1750568 RepID=UPI00190474FE|nr:uncharacterized protein EI90DRAFT_3090413 [Cantharellus anzutake]KAF8314391.1 hypothetical protein EI90DRAFT_3090413 [Cantharellus anzutake]
MVVALRMTLCIAGFVLVTSIVSASSALLGAMCFSSNHRPALRGMFILAIILVPLHLMQLVTGILLLFQYISSCNSINEVTAKILRSCHHLVSVPIISVFHSLRLICECFSCRRIMRPILLFCWVITIFLCAAESVSVPPIRSHGLFRNRILATAMFANTICLVLGFTTSLIGLWHVSFKWRKRCILAFLLVLPVQLPRGFLLLFWPNPLVMDLTSVLSGPAHYLSFLILVLRISSWGSVDEGIALSPISPESGGVAINNDSPVPAIVDASNDGEILVIGLPPRRIGSTSEPTGNSTSRQGHWHVCSQ